MNGQFGGTIFVDILLETLNQQVANVSYRGIGSAAIIEQTGNIIASKGKAEPMTNFKDIPGLGAKFDEMAKNKTGFFKVDTGDDMGDAIIAYATVENTGWIVSLAVPEDEVFATLNKMKVTYAVLTLLGILLMGFMCRKLSNGITEPVQELEAHAQELAQDDVVREDRRHHQHDNG